MKVFQNMSEAVNRLTEIVATVLMCVLVVVIAAEVFARYGLNSSLSWSEELGRILFVWVIFLGTSIGYKQGAHMGIHFVTEMASEGIKRVISKVSLLCSAFFFIFIVIQGVNVTLQMASQLTPALEISRIWQLLPIPVGAFLMLLHTPALLIATERVGAVHALDTSA